MEDGAGRGAKGSAADALGQASPCACYPPLDAVLRALLDARSRLTIIPLQDVFGWSDRINTPAQITADNWSWMLPWRVDRMLDQRKARDRAAVLAQWTREANR